MKKNMKKIRVLDLEKFEEEEVRAEVIETLKQTFMEETVKFLSQANKIKTTFHVFE